MIVQVLNWADLSESKMNYIDGVEKNLSVYQKYKGNKSAL